MYHIVKPWWKKVWQIMTVERLAEKHWHTEVHLHRECYNNSEN